MGGQGNRVLVGEGKRDIVDRNCGTEVELLEVEGTVLAGQIDGEIKSQPGLMGIVSLMV
jgi:hypothetical protein